MPSTIIEKLIGVIGTSPAFSTTRRAIATASDTASADHRSAGDRFVDEPLRKK
jgi:hypothetical protein